MAARTCGGESCADFVTEQSHRDGVGAGQDQPDGTRARWTERAEDIGIANLEATPAELGGEADLINLLVNYPPKASIARLVNWLKGALAKRLRRERPDIARRYWKGGLWSPINFAASCGGTPITMLKQYIEGQQAPY